MDEREGDVEAGAVAAPGEAGLGQDGATGVETEVVLVVPWIGARVKVEDDMVGAIVPEAEAGEPALHVADVPGALLVSVQGVERKDEKACRLGVIRVERGVSQEVQHLGVGPAHGGGVQLVQRVDVVQEWGAARAAGEVEARLHAARRGMGN